MPDGQPPESHQPLILFGCDNLHAFFFSHDICPLCGTPLHPIQSSPEAVLISHTIVRVSPTGSPFKLGLARVENGAQTLCIIDDDAESRTRDVTVYKKDGLYHARKKE